MPNHLQKYLEILQIDAHEIYPIVHEETLSSCLYKIVLHDKTTYILKISYDEKRWHREKYFLQKVKDYILVPKIITTVAFQEDLPGAILMEYIPGEIISAKNLSEEIAYDMGKLLAKVHEIPCAEYGDIADKDFYMADVANGILLLRRYFEEAFDECKHHIDKTLLQKIEKFFYKELTKITYLDGPCVTHRDFKPGNILVNNGKIKGLIDWEIARLHFAEEDFSQMEYLVWDTYPQTKEAFFQGYQVIRKIPDLSVIMPVLRISKALGAIGFAIKRNAWENSLKFVFEKNLHYLKVFFKE